MTTDMGRQETPRALVTGCSSGIGLEITRRLLRDGWQVTGLSRRAPDIEDPGLTFVPVDLSDPEATEAALASVGPMRAVVHAAGLLRVGGHESLDRDEGARMWRLHVDVAAQLVSALAPGMADGGRFVLVGSRVAAGAAGRSLYAASKSALVGFARSVAAELAPRGITVNIVAPGATDTPMLHDPARAGSAPRKPPMGRLVKPAEVAGTAVFLLSDDAASITGQQIVLCGGGSL
ncbi:SDR family NAD(P)-dependent oxidoreductase [Salipiger mucosus]|uniref:3-oxoacyl-[acyl-carrier protein] reductase n=1 Tax=Salipiger mucosus DSM 16094 TaxID=1123237 RepID=S9QBE5_9RHOB|nr:SDR family oxidoreductase [Salipiger mucosus]EPX78731.1 3-oxoacyl-[acyl-carrier protein] reductase [Salipiger mucosus DSM 16094]